MRFFKSHLFDSVTWALVWVALSPIPLTAQTLRFYAQPWRVQEGDPVTLVYLEKGEALARTEIAAWEWDVDGDGIYDQSGVAPEDGSLPNLNAVWYAVYDRNQAVGGQYKVKPRLRVTTRTGQTLSVEDGVTEDVNGLVTGNAQVDRDPEVVIVAGQAGNGDVKVTFGPSQRMVMEGESSRFYSQVEFLRPGRVLGVDWNFNGETNFVVGGLGVTNNVTSPTWKFELPAGTARPLSFPVVMRVRYQIRTNDTAYSSDREVVRFLPDSVRVLPAVAGGLEIVQLGRAYRRGFPEQYDWNDILQAYTAKSATGDERVYFHLMEKALLNIDRPEGLNPAQRQLAAEIVNELLQGQLLVGNQQLIQALRVKYPRLTNPDDAGQRLPLPPGVRTQTAAIELALLDFQAALFHVFQVIQKHGPELLRSKAEPGREPFPDFPRYITFEDPSLSPQKPIPIKNEWWQLTSLLDRLAMGTVEKAKKLFRLSISDPTARAEAREECKRAGLQGYYGMVLLAAGQSTNDFALNEGNSLLAHVKNARDLFETINAGLNPLQNDGSFVPNESFAAIHQDAQEAVNDAKSAEMEARNEKREFDQRQSVLRSELLSQRTSYITPLKLLTGVDPAQYNNLQTYQDQLDFRTTVYNRIQNLLRNYQVGGGAAGAGEIGQNILAVLDAQQNLQQRINDLDNLFKRVGIMKWTNIRVDQLEVQGLLERQPLDVLQASFHVTKEAAQAGFAASVAAVAASGEYWTKVAKESLAVYQNIRLRDEQQDGEIKAMLLNQANLAIDIELAKSKIDQSRLALESAEQRMERLIEDLSHTRATAENLYFTDPSFRVVVSQAERRAEAELDYAVDRLYRLAKTLEYEWTEPYQNALVIPALSAEPAALENPLFDPFTQLDSVFNIRSSDEAKDYLDALKAWDSKLRRINLVSVRGPNHAGPVSAEPISLREQVFNFRPLTLTGTDTNGLVVTNVQVTLADSIRQFRDFVETRRVQTPQNTANPSLELRFATTIEDNRFFPATGAEWNMRIASVRVDLLGDSGVSGTQVAEVDLTQSGMVTLRRFFAKPPGADDLYKLTFNAGRIDRSAFTIKVPARINGASGGRSPAEFESRGLEGRPVAATEWILRIDTAKPANRSIDFSKIKDIVLRFTYTYGNPPEFPGF